jgi:hypothetical protein
MHKTMSLKQIAANQQNALKSTGPKTAEGRAVSKMNALKHGICSKEVLVHGLYFQESSQELAALHERFWHTYNPVGPAEEMLVDQIVTAHWRLRRAMRAESGEIALSVDGGAWQRSQPNALPGVEHWAMTGKLLTAMQESAFGNSLQAVWLREIRARLANQGQMTEADIKKFVLDDQPNVIAEELKKLCLRLAQPFNDAEAAARREEVKKEALAYIDHELLMREFCTALCKRREAAEESARQSAAVLPAPEVLDKILRYETKHERQIFRAMNQLERLQRMRQGETVPPPMTMEVSERV